MKRALLISPYFTPSNLAGVHRVRLMAGHLAEFGWEPIVVTVHPRHYEEPGDAASLALLPEGLRVERVGAWPARICRALGFGDIALRGQWTLRRRVGELITDGEVALVFATVLPGYTSLVGAWAKRKFNVPFVLDYQDPWVSDAGARQPRLSKAGLAHWLARKLEPGVVPRADALTAVSDETLATLRQRRLLRNGVPVEIIPIGAEASDHETARKKGRSWIEKTNGVLDLAYLGTITERMLPALNALFGAMARLALADSGFRLKLHLIGTSAQPDGRDSHRIMQWAASFSLSMSVRLEPRRIGYLDALRTMQLADLLLLLGSTDSHYTASKLFPCWLSGKPMFALFHEASTVCVLARELGGVRIVTYDGGHGPETRMPELAEALRQILFGGIALIPQRNAAAFEKYSSWGIARQYAGLFDRLVREKISC